MYGERKTFDDNFAHRGKVTSATFRTKVTVLK